MESDKFHANCYSHSGAVMSTHYLLRQKAYNVMWGGSYVTIDDALDYISDNDVLLGISAYRDYDSFERNNTDLPNERYYDKVKFIDENSKLWDKINVWNDAMRFFVGESGDSFAKYSGFLLNHTQKLAINLADYYEQSKSFGYKHEMVIDPVPVFTETGGGAGIVFLTVYLSKPQKNLREHGAETCFKSAISSPTISFL